MSPPRSATSRLRRVLLRAGAVAGLLASSQLSACFGVGNNLGGSPTQYLGGPQPSPGGNYNPVAGRPSSGAG